MAKGLSPISHFMRLFLVTKKSRTPGPVPGDSPSCKGSPVRLCNYRNGSFEVFQRMKSFSPSDPGYPIPQDNIDESFLILKHDADSTHPLPHPWRFVLEVLLPCHVLEQTLWACVCLLTLHWLNQPATCWFCPRGTAFCLVALPSACSGRSVTCEVVAGIAAPRGTGRRSACLGPWVWC